MVGGSRIPAVLRAKWRQSKQAVRSEAVEVDLDPAASAPDFRPESLQTRRRKPVLNYPSTVPAEALSLLDEDLVIGIEMEDGARLYPASALLVHHLVNDRIGERHVLITYCAKCLAGIAFDPVIEQQALTFDLFGAYRGTIAMRDEQTDTLWSSYTGRSLHGKLVSHSLEFLPAHMASFRGWLEQHPDSLAPSPEELVTRLTRPADSFLGSKLRASVSVWDERLPSEQLVLGVTSGAAARAYVFRGSFDGLLVCEDVVGSVPVVILGAQGFWPIAFDRRVGATTLSFEVRDGEIKDRSGSTWKPYGQAVAGPLRGTRLGWLGSRVSKWYVWAEHNPGTDIAELCSPIGTPAPK